MAEEHRIERQIEEFSEKLKRSPTDIEMLLQRGKLLYKIGKHGEALNDFNTVGELEPDNVEAREYRAMIESIFEFRYVDYYNP